MIEKWHRQIRLAIPVEQWELLPPFAGFKNEYFDGTGVWSPRPKLYNAVLDLSRADSDQMMSDSAVAREEGIVIRSLGDSDWDDLPELMAAAFHRVPPFCTLPWTERVKATTDCLEHTRGGGDGEFLIHPSVVATASDAKILGAMLITRWEPEKFDEPADKATSAHITWIFVPPLHCGHGIGTMMLSSAVQRLRQDGFVRLYTTFLAGNESSMLWHWRNGFRLLPYLGSMRRWAHGERTRHDAPRENEPRP
jgi:GNAT superfamily N-acetyltransferase